MVFAAMREDLAIHRRRVASPGVRFLLAFDVGARLRLLARLHRKRRQLPLEILTLARWADGRMARAHERLEIIPAGPAVEVVERHSASRIPGRRRSRTVLSPPARLVTNLWRCACFGADPSASHISSKVDWFLQIDDQRLLTLTTFCV